MDKPGSRSFAQRTLVCGRIQLRGDSDGGSSRQPIPGAEMERLDPHQAKAPTPPRATMMLLNNRNTEEQEQDMSMAVAEC